MTKTVLITGASGGIGYELIKCFANDGFDCILVARRGEVLESIKESIESSYKVHVYTLALDLQKPESVNTLVTFTDSLNIPINVLVNNAGFGDYGPFIERDLSKQTAMIDLNITALMTLTQIYAQKMVHLGGGKILNVGSVASFVPGPLMSVYYASKSFVLSFSEALAVELKPSGITVTVLCPGPTKTGFEDAADLGRSGLFKNLKNATAADVAQTGYKALMRGKTIVVHGALNKLVIFATRFAPRKLVRFLTYTIQK